MPPDFSTLTEGRRVRQVRRMSWALIGSVGLNIALGTLLLLEQLDDPDVEQIEPVVTATVVNPTNGGLLRQLQEQSLDQLITRLDDVELVEDGYTVRDLALAVLVTDRHFDLSRALQDSNPVRQCRTLCFGGGDEPTDEVTVYPGLKRTQWQAILQFARTERWPMTSQGLFLRLKEDGVQADRTLVNAFLFTPEFTALEQLLTASTQKVSAIEVLQMLLEGDWELLSHLALTQRTTQDLSRQRRREILETYLDIHSSAAAQILLITDAEYAAKRLSDETVIQMLSTLEEHTPAAEAFALDLLMSPRSDYVWKAAAERLYAFSGEQMPQPYEHMEALRRFAPPERLEDQLRVIAASAEEPPAKSATPAQPQTKDKPYVVEKGDSLWKISRRYHISIERLKQHNDLTSDMLRPGTTLMIPQ